MQKNIMKQKAGIRSLTGFLCFFTCALPILYLYFFDIFGHIP